MGHVGLIKAFHSIIAGPLLASFKCRMPEWQLLHVRIHTSLSQRQKLDDPTNQQPLQTLSAVPWGKSSPGQRCRSHLPLRHRPPCSGPQLFQLLPELPLWLLPLLQEQLQHWLLQQARWRPGGQM